MSICTTLMFEARPLFYSNQYISLHMFIQTANGFSLSFKGKFLAEGYLFMRLKTRFWTWQGKSSPPLVARHKQYSERARLDYYVDINLKYFVKYSPLSFHYKILTKIDNCLLNLLDPHRLLAWASERSDWNTHSISIFERVSNLFMFTLTQRSIWAFLSITLILLCT